MKTPQCWLWPDRLISSRESGKLREEHNALVNECVKLRELLKATCNAANELYHGADSRAERERFAEIITEAEKAL